MMLPSRQDDGNIRAPALACVVACGVVVVCGERVCRSLIVVSYCLSSSTPPQPNPLHCGDGRLVGQLLHTNRAQPLSISSIHGLTLLLLDPPASLDFISYCTAFNGAASLWNCVNFETSAVYSELYPNVIVSDVAVRTRTLWLLHECELLVHHLHLLRYCC